MVWPSGKITDISHSVPTYLGCLITVLALSYSTFTQQLLGQSLVLVDQNGTSLGNLPRSETWDKYVGPESTKRRYMVPATSCIF